METPVPTKCVIYLRLSSACDGVALADQLRATTAHVDRHFGGPATHVIEGSADPGTSKADERGLDDDRDGD
jgi:hypothetical protein